MEQLILANMQAQATWGVSPPRRPSGLEFMWENQWGPWASTKWFGLIYSVIRYFFTIIYVYIYIYICGCAKKSHNLLEMNIKSHHKMQWFLYVQIDFLPSGHGWCPNAISTSGAGQSFKDCEGTSSGRASHMATLSHSCWWVRNPKASHLAYMEACK